MSPEDAKKMVDDFNEVMAEMKKNMEGKGREIISALLKPWFEANPTIEAISWTQYTPYFNDGDTCEFSAHIDYPDYRLVDSDPDDEMDDFPYDDKNKKSLVKILSSINEEIYLEAFGDHKRIVVNRDGTVEIEEYEHD